LFTTTLGELAVGGVLFVTTVELTVFVSAKTCDETNSNIMINLSISNVS
jgi:hypothetical protein